MSTETDAPPTPWEHPGPCGICGWHPDQRHRVLDAIFDYLVGGEDIGSICKTYEWTPDEVRGLYYDVQQHLVDEIHRLRGDAA